MDGHVRDLRTVGVNQTPAEGGTVLALESVWRFFRSLSSHKEQEAPKEPEAPIEDKTSALEEELERRYDQLAKRFPPKVAEAQIQKELEAIRRREKERDLVPVN